MRLPNWIRNVRQGGRRDCTSLGPGAVLRGRPYILNQGRMIIGARLRLSSSPVVSHLVTEHRGVLEIGDDVVISFGAGISCHERVLIGDGTCIGAFLTLADSDFHVVGNRTASPEPRPVEIGRRVRIGARVTVLPGSIVGDGAIIAAGSTVAGTIAAGEHVAGVPARTARAHGGAGSSPTADTVRSLVARVLGLPRLPELSDGPAQIPEWDSLGALRLLLALEEEFGVRVADEKILLARRVADLAALVGGIPPDA
jgi:acetyltransferase-like isoleucine patch superfamily enzyme/acyl carrier protein